MNQPKKERFKTSVGGQALMEGIMMRGPKLICCAVRKPDGTIETKLDPVKNHGVWTKIPLVRGAISMIESLIVGYRYMMYSAQVSMGDDYDPEEEETAYEGCLSFPGHNGAVTRPVAVKVRAQDRHGEWFELEAGDLLGRCIQHENDHLDGITIMQSSEYFYEDTEEGKKAAREAKGNN